MGDPNDDHEDVLVLDGIHDSVVADPDPPQPVEPDEWPATMQPWIGAQLADGPDDPPCDLTVELAEFLGCRWAART
jgi:hypothetical protein